MTDNLPAPSFFEQLSPGKRVFPALLKNDAMNLELLHAFVTLGEVCNFSEAAAHLGISQPTLSKQIRRLEDVLTLEAAGQSLPVLLGLQVAISSLLKETVAKPR